MNTENEKIINKILNKNNEYNQNLIQILAYQFEGMTATINNGVVEFRTPTSEVLLFNSRNCIEGVANTIEGDKVSIMLSTNKSKDGRYEDSKLRFKAWSFTEAGLLVKDELISFNNIQGLTTYEVETSFVETKTLEQLMKVNYFILSLMDSRELAHNALIRQSDEDAEYNKTMIELDYKENKLRTYNFPKFSQEEIEIPNFDSIVEFYKYLSTKTKEQIKKDEKIRGQLVKESVNVNRG